MGGRLQAYISIYKKSKNLKISQINYLGSSGFFSSIQALFFFRFHINSYLNQVCKSLSRIFTYLLC